MIAPREVAVAARPARLIAGLLLAGLFGCAHQPPTTAPPAAVPPPSATGAAAPPSPPAVSPAPGPASGTGPEPGAASTPAAAASSPARAAAPTSARASAPKRPAPPAGTAPAAASPAAAAATAAAEAGSAAGATSVPPAALDLAALEQRLRDTHAIGLFTKLSLKNQVDDLLAQFRSFYAGQAGLSLTGLRRTYELLLMKVVTLLQDDDPGLASAVASSRDAIWGILSDRNRFNRL